MTVKEIILFVLAVGTLILFMVEAARLFHLSRDQASWFDIAVSVAIVLGIALWQRWKDR